MPKYKIKMEVDQKAQKPKSIGKVSAKNKAYGMQLGDEPIPGMKLKSVCRGHQGTIGRIAWSPCGRFIASPSNDMTIRIWDASTGKCLAELIGHTDKVISIAWSPQSQFLVSGGHDSKVRVWNLGNESLIGDRLRILETSKIIREYENKYVCQLAWSAINDLAIGVSGGLIEVLKTKDWQVIHKIKNEDYGSLEIFQWLTWSPDGKRIANVVASSVAYPKIFTLNNSKSTKLKINKEGANNISGIVWSKGDLIATALSSGAIIITDSLGKETPIVLEGHIDHVFSMAFSSDSRLFASKSIDNTVRVWDTSSWNTAGLIVEKAPSEWPEKWAGGLCFHPFEPLLATLGEDNLVIRIWGLETEKLSESARKNKSTRYTSAKVVIVGESNVGKSCLAMRVAEDRYPADFEQGTTHGMRFWPMEAEELHMSAKPREGQRRDVVLWDFGGQDEYQLVHQMFLQDTTLALVLIDPTRGRAATDDARDWNKRLEKHIDNERTFKLLVGAKVDNLQRSKLIDLNSIELLKKECGFSGFIDLSAKTGRNTKRLRKMIADALDWDRMAMTSRPELFQLIRDDVERRRREKEIAITLTEFKKAIKKSAGGLYEESAVDAVTDQLAKQGIIVRTKLTSGDEVLVLQLPIIEQYAGSLIIAARNNLRGVPVLEERLLGSTKSIPLPGMTKQERISPLEERIVLECIVELMIQHGICFRHGGLLVFPTLFPAISSDDKTLPHSVSLYYDFTGAIDNIYASLVSKLMVSEEFGEGRLRAGRVEFERGRQGVCGIRQIKRAGGLAHIDLFFSDQTSPDRKDLFTRFVEEHLRTHGVDIREHQAIKCQCDYEISETIIEENIKRGEPDVICPVCRRTTSIGEGVDQIRKRSPETDAKMIALRKTIDVKITEDINSAKKMIAGEFRKAKQDDPIRILHLSDLHFTGKTNPKTKLNLLLQDIRQQDEEYLAIDTIEYLVISGDMTDKGQDVGFEKALQFVQALVSELGLSTQRCIFVPGNHDVQDRSDAYEDREGIDGKPMLVRHPDNFKKRFQQFSNGFFHPLLQKDYPLNYEDQGISYLYPETGIQFFTLNSAWQIDKNGRNKAGIHPDAIANVISHADEERRRAIECGDFKKNQEILRIGVWHHAVAGPELMQDQGFLTQLHKAGMQLCLHGDVHEPRTEIYGHRKYTRKLEILGAGSFGSGAEGRPESTPKLYNLLEVFIDPNTMQHKSIRVHTRQQSKSDDAWKGYYEWPNLKGYGHLPYFDIDLNNR